MLRNEQRHDPATTSDRELGFTALLLLLAVVLAVAWYVTLFASGGTIPVATLELPLLGPLPLPLVLLAGSVIGSAVIGFGLSLHAGWIGRRIGHRLAAQVRAAVASEIESAGMSGLSRVEAVRRQLTSGRGE